MDGIIDDMDLESRLGADVLDQVSATLGAAGDITAREDAEFILAEVLGIDAAEVRDGLADRAFLSVDQLAAVLELTERFAGRS